MNIEFKLPIVDFSSFSKNQNFEAQLQTSKEINKANRQHGFVCLRNSGIPKHKIESMFDASKELFHYEENQKQQLKQIDPSTNTGYIGFEKESLNRNRKTDLKEAFNVRNTSFQNGDLMGTPSVFQDQTMNFWEDLKVLGSNYATCCALALGLDRQYFVKTLDTMDMCTLRMLHYPPCDSNIANAPLDDTCAIRVGEHTDFGIFTCLFIHDFRNKSSLGLQVKAVEGSEMNYHDNDHSSWNDVVFDNESLQLIDEDDTCAVIVNTGALMARWTNDIWRATAHRVIVSPDAFSHHRYSIAMFFDPDSETLCSVHPKFVEEGQQKKYHDIKSIDYLLMKLKEAQGV